MQCPPATAGCVKRSSATRGEVAPGLARTKLCWVLRFSTTQPPNREATNEYELRVFVPRSRRKSSVGRRGRGALLGAGRIWKFQAGGSDVEAGGAGEMV